MGAQGVADKAGQVSEAYLRPKDTVPEMQRRSATALRLAQAWGGQGAPGVLPGNSPGVTPPGGAPPTAVGPAIGAPGGRAAPNITPGMTDLACLHELAKRYPAMAAPNDTSQRPNATAQDGGGGTVPVAPSPIASRSGGTDVAGPGAGPGSAADTLPPIETPHPLYQPGQPGLQGRASPLAPPPVASPATGQNSPQFQAALELNRRAQALDLVVDPTGRAKALAASLRAQAALYMQADSVSYDPATGIGTKALTGERVNAPTPAEHWVQNPDGTLTNTSTGKKEFPPTGRQFTDAQGNNWIVLPGGGVKQVTSNPSGVTGSGDDASALRIMNEIGPKIANGTATPQEQANYTSATEIYRKPVLQTDPVTRQTLRVYTRDLPQGFPAPPGLGGGAPGQPPAGGAPGGHSGRDRRGFLPAQPGDRARPGGHKVAESQYDRDSKEIPAIGDAGRQSQADQVRIKEMQDVLQRFSTGSGTEARTAAANWFQRWLPSEHHRLGKAVSQPVGRGRGLQAYFRSWRWSAPAPRNAACSARVAVIRPSNCSRRQTRNVDPSGRQWSNKSILDMQMISNQANQDYFPGPRFRTSLTTRTKFGDNA